MLVCYTLCAQIFCKSWFSRVFFTLSFRKLYTWISTRYSSFFCYVADSNLCSLHLVFLSLLFHASGLLYFHERHALISYLNSKCSCSRATFLPSYEDSQVCLAAALQGRGYHPCSYPLHTDLLQPQPQRADTRMGHWFLIQLSHWN